MRVCVHRGDARVILFSHIICVLRETRSSLLHHMALVMVMVHRWLMMRLLVLVLVMLLLGRHAVVLVSAASRQVLALLSIMWLLLLLLQGVVSHRRVAEVGKGGSAMQNMATRTEQGQAWRWP